MNKNSEQRTFFTSIFHASFHLVFCLFLHPFPDDLDSTKIFLTIFSFHYKSLPVTTKLSVIFFASCTTFTHPLTVSHYYSGCFCSSPLFIHLSNVSILIIFVSKYCPLSFNQCRCHCFISASADIFLNARGDHWAEFGPRDQCRLCARPKFGPTWYDVVEQFSFPSLVTDPGKKGVIGKLIHSSSCANFIQVQNAVSPNENPLYKTRGKVVPIFG